LLTHGFVWQLVTYLFFHANLLHLGLNMLTVLLFGSGLESEVGGSRFWKIFLTGGVLGGAGWLAVVALLPHVPSIRWLADWMPQAVRAWFPAARTAETLDTAMCMGASGGVFALIGAYAALFPNRLVYLLLIVVPVKLKARSLAYLLGVLTVAEAVFVQSQVAYAAHLAGGISGYLYGMQLRRQGLFGRED
jgi:membrane associated rhomboid family serine protease